eukprot:scaffold1213_cov63-Cylindrotheca_fusiformis.AAC.2
MCNPALHLTGFVSKNGPKITSVRDFGFPERGLCSKIQGHDSNVGDSTFRSHDYLEEQNAPKAL